MKRDDYSALIDSYGNHFSVSEFEIQGSIEKMDASFMQSLLAWRAWHGSKTLISSAWRENDSGTHGKGLAIDCLLFDVWLSSQPSALRHFLLGTTWSFKGVGLYFDWNYMSGGQKIPAVGLHLDGYYYYQSLIYGTFYCRLNKKTITLEDTLKEHIHLS